MNSTSSYVTNNLTSTLIIATPTMTYQDLEPYDSLTSKPYIENLPITNVSTYLPTYIAELGVKRARKQHGRHQANAGLK